MQIDIGKVIETYGCCITLLKAKLNIFRDNSEINDLLRKPGLGSKQSVNHYTQFVTNGMVSILRIWAYKVQNLHQLHQQHQRNISQLQFKLHSLQKNPHIMTLQDKNLTEIQSAMRGWRQNMNPVDYYSTKSCKNLKNYIEIRLSQINKSPSRPYCSVSAADQREIEKQFKQNLSECYISEFKIDQQLINSVADIHNSLAKQTGQIDDAIDMNISHRQLSSNYEFLNSIQQAKSMRPSDSTIRTYIDSLIEGLKKNYNFWNEFKKGLQNQISLIQQLSNSLFKIKALFNEKEDTIRRLMSDVSFPIARLFRASVIYVMIKSINRTYQIDSIFGLFLDKIKKRREFAIKMINECKDYLQKISTESNDRKLNFYNFASADKKFFADQFKSEKVVFKLYMQSFRQFLQQFYSVIKQNRRAFHEASKQIALSAEQLDFYLDRLITVDRNSFDTSENMTMKSKQTSPSKQLQNKIEKIEKFLAEIQIFRSDQVSQSQKFYTCALGPKLLLHGKLFLLQKGIYFQSHFNKKTLFGKTKLYIPKAQICDIDMKSTLLVFPDAVVVKTNHGIVSFHALGFQKSISKAMKETYLTDQAPAQQGGQMFESAPSFKAFDQSKTPPAEVIQKQMANYEIIVYQGVLKGSMLPVIYRRYFSDDSFELGSAKYKTFKQYAMTLIQAKNATSTPINPNAPTYFMYQTETSPENHYPTTSIREHNYGKNLPKIPFLSSGGEGKCYQKETYYWLGPDALVIDVLSTVKGFSLTQNMEVHIKYCMRQQNQGVKLVITAQVKFTKDASSNSLVKGPTISNVKESITKIIATIQKCEKSRRFTQTKTNTSSSDSKQQEITPSEQPVKVANAASAGQIQISKQQLQYLVIGFVLFYIVSLTLMKIT